MSKDKEVRNFSLTKLETRAIADSPMRRILGHAAVFNVAATLYGFQEVVMPGAFNMALEEDDVRALFNHDPNFVLGRNMSGTLMMTEDDVGLAIDIMPPDTQWARDLMTSIDRGDISQMSFGFRVRDGGESWDYEGDIPVRKLTSLELYDVSVVTYPAYVDTDVAVRSLNNNRPEITRDTSQIDNARRLLELLALGS